MRAQFLALHFLAIVVPFSLFLVLVAVPTSKSLTPVAGPAMLAVPTSLLAPVVVPTSPFLDRVCMLVPPYSSCIHMTDAGER